MGKLKDEFLGLQERKEYLEKDITERIEHLTEDPTRSCLRSKYGNLLYEDLIPEATKQQRGFDISSLIERKEKRLDTDNPDKEVLGFLHKVIRRKLMVKSLSGKLALGAVEQLLIASYVSKDLKTKNVLKTKAKQLLGVSVSLSDMNEIQDTSREIFSIDERLEVEVPSRFEDNELAMIFTERINKINGFPENKQVDEFTKLLNKIEDAIDSKDDLYDTEDFTVLHHFQSDINRRLDDLEGINDNRKKL